MLLACLLLAVSTAAHAQRSDLIFLENGDRITGEIESIEAGILEISTDTTSNRVRIEWRFVEGLISDTSQSLELADGRRLFGPLLPSSTPRTLLVGTASGPVLVRTDDIVAAWPVEPGFWDNLDLDLIFGLSYASSTGIGTYTLGIDTSYITPDILFDARLRSELTRQRDGEDRNTTRNIAAMDYTRSLEGLRYRSLLAEIEQNDALGIDLRLLAGGVFGRFLIKENRRHWRLGAGLAYAYELPETGSSESNLEGVIATRFRFFQFDSPERDIDASLFVFPSLTDLGRVRSDFRTTFTIEVTGDLDWALEGYFRFDSDPLSEDGDRTEYGVVMQLKYSF
jgi:hypothetical protein